MRQAKLTMKRARGFLLVVAILVVVVVALAIAALGNMTSSDVRSSSAHAQSEQAYFAASSGAEYAAYLLRSGTNTCATLPATSTAVGGAASFALSATANAPAGTTVGGAGVNNAATTIPAVSTAGYASHGLIIIDGEQILYTGTTAVSFTGATRGYGATPAASHLAAASILQNQCTVKVTGTSGTAQRVVESAIRNGPWVEYLDGGSINITSASAAALGSIVTSLPAGDNLIIAAVTMQSTSAVTATQIVAGNLQLRRGAAVLDSNLYPVNIGTNAITNNNRPNKTYFFVFKDAGAAANQTYSVTAQGNNVLTNGEVKMIVINNAPVTTSATGSIASIGNGAQTTIASLASALSAGTNLIIARVHMDNNSAANKFITGGNPGNLQLRRTTAPAAVLASNLFQIDFRAASGARATEEYSVLLIALDSAAPANPTYVVSAQASAINIQVDATILAIQGVGGASLAGASTALGAAATTLVATATAFPALSAGSNNVVIAPTLYINTVAATRNVNANSEAIVFNAVNQTTNTFQYQLCTNGTAQCDHFPAGLLWRQTTAQANPSYSVAAAASAAASVNGQASILAMHLNPVVDRIEIYP